MFNIEHRVLETVRKIFMKKYDFLIAGGGIVGGVKLSKGRAGAHGTALHTGNRSALCRLFVV